MSVNACCCLSAKDSAVAVGIWSLVWSVAQLGIMGWQMAAIKYERDRAANTLLPNYQTYGKFDVPSYYESYWQSPEERYYTGLFVIQVLCLIAAFFNLFASGGLIYGVHVWNRRIIWPWFPCMITCILTSLAYCIMWWCGDVRDYWLAITIIEIIGVFINIYCVVVVLMYYRRINATTDEYEGKDRMVRYKINRMGHSSRRDLLESYDGLHRSPEMPKGGYQYKPLAQPNYIPPPSKPYPAPYSPAGMPQAPLPLPPAYGNTPYPITPAEALQKYEKEPKPAPRPATYHTPDPVASWVEEQQIRRDQLDANSEPISPSRQVHPTTYPVQHSRSVPSLYDGTLVSHKDCRHHKHRSSSRNKHHRSRSRNRYDDSLYYSSESDSDFTRRRDSGRGRHRSRSRYSESEVTLEPLHHRRSSHRDSHRHRHDHNRDSEARRSDRRRSSGRRHRDDEERESQRRRRERGSRDDERPARVGERISRESAGATEVPQEGGATFPLSGGLTIPQHIVIPPSSGERGPDGQPLPQKFQINSEITINYDKNGAVIQQNGHAAPDVRQPAGVYQPPRTAGSLRDGPYTRRNVMQIQSNV